ncbi:MULTISPECIES: hypothetical protein [unclassified Bradyrhizobium]|uniref:hypothetical protein n=1 Tax=unclassified Bradyrhizobium TaxID=2631580 RepID=UPI002479444D|nr:MULTISPECIES: hypothetical protein [unclassified Bradyrhizobium]WGR73869.1 hypothetical protein MTX24_14095 [Bradyrhizobium sp. ISRA426]WGR78706.1 hypothetical protein MTX21_39065 [Bradyrhizobium sp. ISRA430]WGR89108.1 hypothetical protein MTX25_14110 [Bradyrhizobium sp. ISRA432]
MNRGEIIKFISDPAGLGMPDMAEWLADAVKGICGWAMLGGAAVGGYAAVNIQGADAASKGVKPDFRNGIALLLAGAGIGALGAGAVCTKIRLFLNDTFNQFSTAREAMLNLTPRDKQRLVAEAQRLVRMRQQIDQVRMPERSDPRFTQSA